jgi:hypothetical protein
MIKDRLGQDVVQRVRNQGSKSISRRQYLKLVHAVVMASSQEELEAVFSFEVAVRDLQDLRASAQWGMIAMQGFKF